MNKNDTPKNWQSLEDAKFDIGNVYSVANYGHSVYAFSWNDHDQQFVIKDDTLIKGPYSSILCMANGFIRVGDEENMQYIDVLGRVTPKMTESGAQVFAYLNGYARLAGKIGVFRR